MSGRVQGVYYRGFTEKVANELGLTGFCQNLPDGRVWVEVEGDRAVIEELIKKLHPGPPGARVANVQVSWRPWEGRFRDFSIRY